ncbi:MAG: methyltransferase domain-containing protein [Planctomycetota bacterium]
MIERVLEPELMDDPIEAEAYDDMDHDEVNQIFIDDLLALGPCGRDVLDLGTGNALIPTLLCERVKECRVLASDAAVSMLEVARYNIALAGFEERIELHHGDSKALLFDDSQFDAVISNSLIHHVPDPSTVVREVARLIRPGGRIFFRDLMRPESLERVEELVGLYAGGESDECQQLFRQSLRAALTVDEMQKLVVDAGFDAEAVAATSDRHWTWTALRSGA